MLVRRGARAGPGLPRGWTALCLLSLLCEYRPRAAARRGRGFPGAEGTGPPAHPLRRSGWKRRPAGGGKGPQAPTVSPGGKQWEHYAKANEGEAAGSSGFTENVSITTGPTGPSVTTTTVLPTNASNPETTASSALGSTSPSHPPDSSATSEAHSSFSDLPVNVTSTSGISTIPGTVNSSMESQTSPASTAFTTPTNVTTLETNVEPSTLPGNVSNASTNNTSPGEIRCLGIKQVKLTQGICLEQNETSKCEDFKKDKGEHLIRILCEKEQTEEGAKECSLLLAQSEIKPHCLLLVLANGSELPSKLQLMKKHQLDLEKLGIRNFTEESVANHQSYSRKTLIALVTSGILLAILGTTGYFFMNRRSWSPTGERLGEDPYYTESGGGQGYNSGPGGSPEAQGKASVNRGAQENGTGQATSRNGHSARQHAVADTEL
ncbi:hematopoietic progenitor cell antigen CD34 [Rhynchocyon petersi]